MAGGGVEAEQSYGELESLDATGPEVNRSGAETTARRGSSDEFKPPQLTPEARAKLAEIRGRIETSVGQAVLLMMQLPRYRHQSLADLNHLIVEPLLRDRVAIGYAKGEGDPPDSNPAPVGIAIWASVSDDVSPKIEDQIKAGAFPVRLAPDDWSSGEKLWLLDIVSVSKSGASAVLVNFGSIAGDRPVSLHPVVKESVDAELLERMKLK